MAISKLLVANRGEIAIRAFRAANELGIRSVAVYPYEDRHSLHRQKADESYEIGEPGHPVRAYLDVEGIVATALAVGADGVYPGYGFLSENPRLAEACARAGLAFVGPPAAVLTLAGNKLKAVAAARAAGLPVLRSLAPPAGEEGDEAFLAGAAEVGFPLFVKAAAGGGGRGLRRVETAAELPGALAAARREAVSAFGDETLFLEEAVVAPRHIEVQVLADAAGTVLHLYERDCSVQRRHQKVVEIAPAPNLDPELRSRICADAVAFAASIGYQGAGTVEFLVNGAERPDGRHVFIEMNPRIQVEHTVTEEVTGIDLVQAQLRLAGGETLAQLGLDQAHVTLHGAAVQCRITAEDPAHDFRPDTGVITTYRLPGGTGVRIDEGTTVGTEVLPFFDSLLAKLTCRGRFFAEAVDRARRAVAEFRIRGIATNIPFLLAVLDDEDFRAGRLSTDFIELRPGLLTSRPSADRGTRLLRYLAEVTVARPYGPPPVLGDPRAKLPALPGAAGGGSAAGRGAGAAPGVPAGSSGGAAGRAAGAAGGVPAGSRQRLLELGAAGFATWLRHDSALAVCDTTFRDAHQSLLATRLRTFDILGVAGHVAALLPELLSLECWGGATYDVALRFLKEDPWERLEQIRAAVPNICLQMLLRGRNTVGYSPYPDAVCRRFVAEAAAAGMDVFRIFDALNDVEQVRPAVEAVLEAGAVAEGAICYTGDLSDPAEELYTLDYYLRLAERLVATGVHVLCIKDMAGLLRPPAARRLVSAIRERFDAPLRLHTHDTAGGQLATYLAAAACGVDAVDGAMAPLAGTTSQPSLSAIVAATDHDERATGISLDALLDLEPYFSAVRRAYAVFDAGDAAPSGRVYRHEIPGGQMTNLRQQAIALGLGERFDQVEDLYAQANELLGDIVKVTPTSKVVGDLAIYLAAQDVTAPELAADPGRFSLPQSVVGFLEGELGEPAGGWPEPFRSKAIAGRHWEPPAASLTAEQEAALAGPAARAVLSELLFPAPAHEHALAVTAYGNLAVLPTPAFVYGASISEEIEVELEPGVALFLAVDAFSEPDERGYRTAYCRMNGRPRTLSVRDPSVTSTKPSGERADPDDPGQVAAPFAGVVTPAVRAGDRIAAGDVVATIEAMKMDAKVTAPVGGVVRRVVVPPSARVEAGDLLVVLETGP
ncbi:MAG TPA: pyruvate carboxylase [Acidimicrobiales bacterium]|nr:pyruvate carboxylase [Acidimicrobiales bacterium]